MTSEILVYPTGHPRGCSCRACMNITWLRAAEAGADPAALPIEPRPAPRPRAAPLTAGEQPLGLVARFRAAAMPGDFAALLLGTQIGILLCAVLIAAHYRALFEAWVASW